MTDEPVNGSWPRTKWFGPFPEPRPPIAEDLADKVESPIGELCASCDEAIGPDDYGLMMWHVMMDEPPGFQPWHFACEARHVIGSVGHQQKKCSCFGGDEDDPPGMTKRQAAEAALVYFEEHLDV